MTNEKSDQFVFIWRIEKYNMNYHKFGEVIKSPEYTAENLGGTRWYMNFYPNGYDTNFKTHCACHLFRSGIDACGSRVAVTYTMEILDPCGKIEGKFDGKYTIFNVKQGSGSHAILDINDLKHKMKTWMENTLTIRCKISRKPIRNKPAIGCNASTSFFLERCSFVSELKNNDLVKNDTWTESKEFSFPNKSQFKVTLSLPNDQLIVNISKQSNTNFNQLVHCKVTFDDKGKRQMSKSGSHLFECTNNCNPFELPFMIKTDFGTDSFILMFEFSSSKSYLSKIENYDYEKDDLNAHAALHDDLRTLYISKKSSDVQLKVDSETFSAHKLILSSRSPVFGAMFEQEMLENETNVVEIQDSDAKTVAFFLEFLYTGTLESVGYESVLKLFILSDKYQVISLKGKCYLLLLAFLSIENVCEILHVADLVGHELLKTSAMDYIKTHAREILQSPEWCKWIKNNLYLGIEVMCKVSATLAAAQDEVPDFPTESEDIDASLNVSDFQSQTSTVNLESTTDHEKFANLIDSTANVSESFRNTSRPTTSAPTPSFPTPSFPTLGAPTSSASRTTSARKIYKKSRKFISLRSISP